MRVGDRVRRTNPLYEGAEFEITAVSPDGDIVAILCVKSANEPFPACKAGESDQALTYQVEKIH
jgi:hypothetical protein